jgi:hypothetical protein
MLLPPFVLPATPEAIFNQATECPSPFVFSMDSLDGRS